MSLTKRQTQIYSLLKRRWSELGRQPPLSESAAELGMHYVSLKSHLAVLAEKGYLEIRPQGSGRSPILSLRASESEDLLALVGRNCFRGYPRR